MKIDKNIYLIVSAIPNSNDVFSYNSYVFQIAGVFNLYGAVNVNRYRTIEQIMGNSGAQTTAIFTFPNVQAIKDMMASEEFNALNELREKAFSKMVDYIICEN
jgi:uncharacterized protein (DUF1330 family)